MAYGFKIKNQLGEDVLEYKKTYYKKEVGTCTFAGSAHNAARSSANTAGYSNSNIGQIGCQLNGGYSDLNVDEANGSPVWGNRLSYVASSGFTWTNVISGKALSHPILNLGPEDLVFYDISSYGITASAINGILGFPDGTPSGSFACNQAEGALPYTIVSPTPPSIPTETFGMKIFDATGATTFDSRSGNFSIVDHIVVNAKLFDNVIAYGGLYFDITLSTPQPGFLVCLPYFNNYSNQGSRNFYNVELKKVNDSTLRFYLHLSRNNSGSAATPVRTFTSDLVILIGK